MPGMRTRLLVTTTAMLVTLAVSVALLSPGAGPATATGTASMTSPDTGGDVGKSTSLVLDASGYPVVSYYDATDGDLKVLRCNDPSCSGGNESITSPDTGGNVGQYTSLALDASGHPVVSHYDATNGDLRVIHCNDPNCTGGDESTASFDGGGVVGRYTSLALDSAGNPVVSYYDDTNGDLKVLHCNDPNCSGADESNTSPDTDDVVGRFTSLELDAAGNPVVSYYDDTNGDLKVLHCNDPDCSGGDESITSPDSTDSVGQYTSLALDGSGYPVVSYYDSTNGDLKVLRCNDPNCSGDDESVSAPDTDGYVGFYTSLALDSDGNPMVSYSDLTDYDLKVLHCNDASCSGGDESITSPDSAGSVGQHTSLALDGKGKPVVGYHDSDNADLKVLHCGDADCTDAKQGQIVITNVGQYTLPKTCFDVRDDLQSPLFVLCDNDFQGTPESDPVCVPDGVCDDEDPAEGLIRVTVDIAAYSVEVAKPPPNHTADAGKLSCDVSAGKCHVTLVNTPNTNPWHPWDNTGDGRVRVDDILAVVNHYFEDKVSPTPTATPTP